MSTLVLTLIGPDRAGLVELLADTLAAHGANWLGSRMSRLAGKFAGILEVEVSASRAESLRAALDALSERGLRIVTEPSEGSAIAPHRTLGLELVGQDRPGIVREISHALAEVGVNVEELETSCSPAPMSGEMLFSAAARVALPPGVSLELLQQRLERIASDLMVDLEIQDAAPVP